MDEPIRWPMAIYFDASVLRQLPLDLSSPELARLNEVVARFAIGKFVPEIAEREWIFSHEEVAKRKRDSLMSTVRLLADYAKGVAFTIEGPSEEELLEGVRRAQTDRLAAAGFQQIPTPAADVTELLESAIRRIKPFTDGDRGFRDTMIVRTITEHARQFAPHAILIVSADGVFDHPEVRHQWEAVGVKPIVAKSLGQAVTDLDAAMDQAFKRYLDREAEKIKAFLVARQQQIFDSLTDVEVSEGFIKGGPLDTSAYYGTLERIKRVRPLEITRVSRGHVLGPTSKEGDRVPVTFYVKIAFDIIVSEISFANLFGGSGPRFRLGDAVDLVVPKGWSLSQPTEREMTVEREVAVEAWIIEGDEGVPKSLEITKIAAW